MALWGHVMVNEDAIATWSARRLEDLATEDQVSLYHCIWEERQQLPGWHGEAIVITEAVIEHRYSDGAAVLAQKVLTLAEGGW